jgi:hypothetical protein
MRINDPSTQNLRPEEPMHRPLDRAPPSQHLGGASLVASGSYDRNRDLRIQRKLQAIIQQRIPVYGPHRRCRAWWDPRRRTSRYLRRGNRFRSVYLLCRGNVLSPQLRLVVTRNVGQDLENRRISKRVDITIWRLADLLAPGCPGAAGKRFVVHEEAAVVGGCVTKVAIRKVP